MRPAAKRRATGFTLIEVLISLSIFSLILIAIYQLFDSSHRTYASGTRKLDVQQSARAGMDEMVRQLRMAGYYPQNYINTDLADDITGNNRLHVHSGNESRLSVFGDLNGLNTAAGTTVFTFCLSGGSLLRVQNSYDCTGSDVLADNISNLKFTYFDANNGQLPPNPVPATSYKLDGEPSGAGTTPLFGTITQRWAVQAIQVSITARETVPGQAPQVYTLSSTVRLRNAPTN